MKRTKRSKYFLSTISGTNKRIKKLNNKLKIFVVFDKIMINESNRLVHCEYFTHIYADSRREAKKGFKHLYGDEEGLLMMECKPIKSTFKKVKGGKK